MDVIVGCTYGSTKVYNLHKSQPVGMFGSLSNSLELQVMKFGWNHMKNKENFLFQGYSNGALKYWDCEEKTLVREFQINSNSGSTGATNIRSIEPFGEDKLLISTLDGTVFIKEFSDIQDLTPKSDITETTSKIKDGKKIKNVVTQKKVLKEDKIIQLLNEQQQKEEKETINSLVMNPDQNGFAYGGKNINISLWDLETERKTWSAKFQHDFLDLQIPVDINAIQYVPKNPSQIFLANENHLKIYDSKMTPKKPVIDVNFNKYNIKTIAVYEGDENEYFGADVVGNISAFDRRYPKQFRPYKGHTGGVRSITFHPTLPILASVGLDRFLKVWDIKKKKITQNIYLKQKLSSVLFRSDIPPVEEDIKEEKVFNKGNDDESEEEDDVWDQIEKNTNKIGNDDDESEDEQEFEIKIKEETFSEDESDDDKSTTSKDKKNKNNKRILNNKPQNNNNKKTINIKNFKSQ